MRRKRLGIVSLISLVALVVLAVGIPASTGSASTDKATKGHKIFFLPKLIGVNVFTENGKGAKEAAEEARRQRHLQRTDGSGGRKAGSVHRLRRPSGLRRDHHLGERPERRRAGAEARAAARSEGHLLRRRRRARTRARSSSARRRRRRSARSRSSGWAPRSATRARSPSCRRRRPPQPEHVDQVHEGDAEAAEVQGHEARQGRLRQ